MRLWILSLVLGLCAAMPTAADIIVSGSGGGTLIWSATPLGGNRYSLEIEVANMPRGSGRSSDRHLKRQRHH